MMPDLHFFQVIWEVACLRDGEWKTGKFTLRSAVQVFSDSLFRFGPDMVELNDPYVCPDPDELIGPDKKRNPHNLNERGYSKVPGEPKIMVASHGKRISSTQVLYELWEDSGLHLLSAEMFFIEPLIFCHAFKALLNHIQDRTFPGAVSDLGKIDRITARAQLAVKKKSAQRIETILTSDARISGVNGITFGMALYGVLRHTSIPEQKIQYALLASEDMDLRCKTVQAGYRAAKGPLRAGIGGNPLINVRASGDPDEEFVVLPVTSGEEKGKLAPPLLASGFLAHMNFYEEPSGLLWIFR